MIWVPHDEKKPTIATLNSARLKWLVLAIGPENFNLRTPVHLRLGIVMAQTRLLIFINNLTDKFTQVKAGFELNSDLF